MVKPSKTTAEAGEQITRSGKSWADSLGGTAAVSFAFRANTSAYDDPNHDNQATFTRFNATEMHAAELALGLWSDLANITFQRVGSGYSTGAGSSATYSDHATILFANYAHASDGAAAYAVSPDPDKTGDEDPNGDVWVNVNDPQYGQPVLGAYTFQVFTHELGHALGLSHPSDYNAGPAGSTPLTYDANAEYAEDTKQYSVMSYFDASLSGADHTRASGVTTYAATPLLHDIAAIQRLYGVNSSTRTGDTVYGFNSNADREAFRLTDESAVVFAIWDAGGNDTLDLSGYSYSAVVDLRPGGFSSAGGLTDNIAVAEAPDGGPPSLDYFIENAKTSTGADKITGNDRANRLEAWTGADTIAAGAGDDTVVGGGGLDEIDGGAGNDLAIYLANDFEFLLFESAGGSYRLEQRFGGQLDGIDDLEGIEFVQFGNTGPLALEDLSMQAAPAAGGTLRGYYGRDDYLHGGNGDDKLFGDSQGSSPIPYRPGADRLWGGSGNDYLSDGRGSDRLLGEDGNDTILAGGDRYADFVDGGAGNDDITIRAFAATIDTVRGGADDDTIRNLEHNSVSFAGGSGNDTLSGFSKADTLRGGQGHDVIFGYAGADRIEGEGGDDRLVASFTDFLGYWSPENEGANEDTLDGGGGDDTLYSGDAQGADILIGGAGRDLAFVYRTTRTIAFDLDIKAKGTQTLADGTRLQSIERIAFSGGSARDAVTGGDFKDSIYGNGGADSLEGGGGDDLLDGGDGDDWLGAGDGINTMDGGAGDDRYFVEASFDLIVEGPGRGRDTVRTLVDYRLADIAEVETLAAADAGDLAPLELTGSHSDNRINGNAGDNVLDGSSGRDTLRGYDGDDTYYVDTRHDVIEEAADGGTDTVLMKGTHESVRVKYVLSDEAKVEKLATTDANGTFSIDLVGNRIANLVTGNAGRNRLEGRGGRDTLDAGAGSDTLVGGAGKDKLNGGSGKDLFCFAGVGDSGRSGSSRDVIADFKLDTDKIDLRSFDADPGTGTLNHFTFIGGATFTRAGQIRATQSGKDALISLNTDALPDAESIFVLRGVNAARLDSLDFLV